MPKTNKALTHEEVSRRGGNSFKKKYGKKVFSEMGKKGAAAKVEKFGKDYFSRIGKISAEKRRKKKEMQNRNAMDNVAALLRGE